MPRDDTINLDELRENVTRWRRNSVEDFIDYDGVLALVEAVEAAQRFVSPPEMQSPEDELLTELRVRAALARFAGGADGG